MLEFLNDLKMSLDGSICSDQDDNIDFEELILSPQPKPFPVLDQQNELEEFFSLDQMNIPQFKKVQKKRRGNKKDDFDYNKYIEREMKKMDTTKMDSNKKKKLIQKIRNRMSAQRSRLRQKRVLSHLEVENQNLLDANKTLVDKVKELEEENSRMKSFIHNFKPENKFSISTDLDSEKEYSQCNTISRSDPVLSMKNDLPFKTFFIIAMICLLTIFSGSTYQTQGVKIGGFKLFNRE